MEILKMLIIFTIALVVLAIVNVIKINVYNNIANQSTSAQLINERYEKKN